VAFECNERLDRPIINSVTNQVAPGTPARELDPHRPPSFALLSAARREPTTRAHQPARTPCKGRTTYASPGSYTISATRNQLPVKAGRKLTLWRRSKTDPLGGFDLAR
jgi:hypothetical protein